MGIDDYASSCDSLENLMDLNQDSIASSDNSLEASKVLVIPGYKPDEQEENIISDEFYDDLLSVNSTAAGSRRNTQKPSSRINTARSNRGKSARRDEEVFELDSKFLTKHGMANMIFQNDLCNDINAECLSVLVKNAEKIFSWNTNNQK